MANAKYVAAIISVKKRAKDGFKLSELSGAELAAAKHLIDQGKLFAFPIRGGDFVVNEK